MLLRQAQDRSLLPARRPKRSSRPSRVAAEPLEGRVHFAVIDIEGVQPAALDQPRVHALLRRTATGEPLTAEAPPFGTTFNIEVYYDTGASGVLISNETANALGLGRATVNGQEVIFED